VTLMRLLHPKSAEHLHWAGLHARDAYYSLPSCPGTIADLIVLTDYMRLSVLDLLPVRTPIERAMPLAATTHLAQRPTCSAIPVLAGPNTTTCLPSRPPARPVLIAHLAAHTSSCALGIGRCDAAEPCAAGGCRSSRLLEAAHRAASISSLPRTRAQTRDSLALPSGGSRRRDIGAFRGVSRRVCLS